MSLLCLGAIGVTLGAQIWSWQAPLPTATEVSPPAARPGDRHQLLQAARHSCSLEAVDEFLAGQRQLVQQHPDDAAALHLLAEALLERVQVRNMPRGLAVGEALYAQLPPDIARDLGEGLRSVRRARELGDDSSENYRIEAGLLGNEITGIGSALRLGTAMRAALQQASERDRNNPRLHINLGLQKLLAPKLLGQDPEQALQHLEFAARSLPDDERPALFAAMAAWLLHQRDHALQWLDTAVQRNPHNLFARAVLDRVRRGEPEPFARDVSPAEASATDTSAPK